MSGQVVRFATIGMLLLAAGACAPRRPPVVTPAPPPASQAMTFLATAYCRGTRTAAGVEVREGFVAADPAVLALGTRIRVEETGIHDGVYTVMDTGAKIQGRRIDVFISDCAEAVRFGRRTVRVWILVRAGRTRT